MEMHRIAYAALTSAILLMGGTSVKADWDHWAIQTSDVLDNTGLKFYTVDSVNDTRTLRTTKCFVDSSPSVACKQQVGSGSYVDAETGKFYLENADGDFHSYDLTTDTWKNEGASWKSTYTTNGIHQRLTVKRKNNGEIHIGDNSWITKEENGRQKVYAKDAAGNPIPIDYTNGTKLLINGRDVDQAIDNVGALSAALTGLPTVPQDSPLACGVGAGTHSGSNALSGGCTSKVSERLSFNAAASFIPANQEYQGTDNSWSGRAGFVFKLGKITKPTLISMKEKKALQIKIDDLVSSNDVMKKANYQLQSKVSKFESENAELISRLEQLEQITLGLTKSTDLANIAP
tara:strand:+ start:450 stop:1487 length:1038 start_codon:yes stop_codon:yes gene_type:complete